MAITDRVQHIRGTQNQFSAITLQDGQIGVVEDKGNERLVFGTIAHNNINVPNQSDLQNVIDIANGAVSIANTASTNISQALTVANQANTTSDAANALSISANAQSIATQNQVANIIANNGNGTTPTEVIDDRTDANGIVHTTIKVRSDSDYNDLKNQISTGDTTLSNKIGDLSTLETTTKDNIVNAINGINLTVTTNTQNISGKVNQSNKLTYKSASVSISGDTTYDSYQTATLYQHLAYQGASMTLVSMVNITSATDPNPVMMSDSKLINCITMASSYGVSTQMLKPHLGVNWSDGFNRTNYIPSNFTTFFSNWKTILLHYASLCNTYNIPILCLGCEQDKTTINTYASNWADIYNTIKSQYPNLTLTYACNQVEWMRDDSSVFPNVDLIGFNVYLQWSIKSYTSDMTYEDIIPYFYTTYDIVADGIHLIDRINYLSKLYNKQAFITEIGIVPIADGLITLLPPDYNNSSQYNYNIYAIVLEALMNVIRVNNFIKGLAIWHSCGLFSYWTDDTSKPGYHAAEEVVKKYFTEVL